MLRKLLGLHLRLLEGSGTRKHAAGAQITDGRSEPGLPTKETPNDAYGRTSRFQGESLAACRAEHLRGLL